MNQKQQSINTNTILLLLCMAVGLLLRVGNPAEISFINDELSTWVKVNFDSIGAVIEHIKMSDSHPVGMYVFVYYWTAIFGTSEIAIKLPFFLMSMASMFLVYRIASLWFSRTVGVLVLAFFSTLQFPIWWSLIARQYQSGLFCTLLMVYCWTQILIKKSNKKRYWAGFVLMGAASMYNHYFSLIFAAIIGLLGFIWMRREILYHYIGAGLLMVLLFAPHIGITNYQLLYADGHKWYNPPTLSFLSKHFFYLFHYSILCWGMILLLLIFSIGCYGKSTFKQHSKARLTALLWFLTPLLFGYCYSVYVSPILRESHLLFSFPYLLFFLLSFFPEQLPSKTKVGLVLAILVLNTYTLMVNRNHFKTIHTHPYEAFVAETQEFMTTHKGEDALIVLGENPVYLQYYKDYYKANFEHTISFREELSALEFMKMLQNNVASQNYKTHYKTNAEQTVYFRNVLSFLEFRELLQNSATSYLIVGSLPEAHIRMAMDYYPYLYKKRYGINYEYYILARNKQPNTAELELDFEQNLDFEQAKKPAGWDYDARMVRRDSMDGNAYFEMLGEWGPTFQMELSNITPRSNQFLDISVDIRAVDSITIQPKGVLVLEVYNQQDSLLAWKGVELDAQTKASKDWQRVYLSVRFAHEVYYNNVKDLKMKTFFWNKEKQAIHLDRFSIKSRKGNLLLYGDTNDFNLP